MYKKDGVEDQNAGVTKKQTYLAAWQIGHVEIIKFGGRILGNLRMHCQEKKDKKATTDWKNVILKRGGEVMVDLIMPVIEAFWSEEAVPTQWNQGIITNIWKGKGDREVMSNQRGITVSSSIGTIAEEVINRRLVKTVKCGD